MAESNALRAPHLPEHFEQFFDDAAVFPPGSAPLDEAVHAHLVRRHTPYGRAVGPLLLASADVATARLKALRVAADLGIDLTVDPLRVAVVVPPGGLSSALLLARAVEPVLRVVGVELRTDPTSWPAEREAACEAARHRAILVEFTAAQVAEGAVADLIGTPLGLKFRTGGLDAALFPTPAELAAVLRTAVGAGVRFKLTAGLHRAVRYTDPATGFLHHGFLNIAVATARARAGVGEQAVLEALASTDETSLRTEFVALTDRWRDSFSSFGTCSVTEPAETLVELALLAPSFLSTPIASAHLTQENVHHD